MIYKSKAIFRKTTLLLLRNSKGKTKKIGLNGVLGGKPKV